MNQSIKAELNGKENSLEVFKIKDKKVKDSEHKKKSNGTQKCILDKC